MTKSISTKNFRKSLSCLKRSHLFTKSYFAQITPTKNINKKEYADVPPRYPIPKIRGNIAVTGNSNKSLSSCATIKGNAIMKMMATLIYHQTSFIVGVLNKFAQPKTNNKICERKIHEIS